MASAKVIVGVKYDRGKRIVVCIPDGVQIFSKTTAGPQTIEWEFHPSIPNKVDDVRITLLPDQPATYPTAKPIPRELLITDLGPIEKDSSSPSRLQRRYTVNNPGRKGYFFYKIELLSKGQVWAVSDPGGENDAGPGPGWPPVYP